MKSVLTEVVELMQAKPFESPHCVIGWIVEVNNKGQALVSHPGNMCGPKVAKSLIKLPRVMTANSHLVVLAWENGNPALPIILGVVQENILEEQSVNMDIRSSHREVRVDGRKLVFEATDEVVLNCGKASISIRKDGKISIKGTHLVSRASGNNKIKGGSVAIN